MRLSISAEPISLPFSQRQSLTLKTCLIYPTLCLAFRYYEHVLHSKSHCTRRDSLCSNMKAALCSGPGVR